ncbi:hypothetical protein RSX31_11705 [Rossellomorea sp. YC4-1]|jgi:hypothetical protein|nr:hypothetical protein [Rossellomorea sp. YC4-1]
MKNFVQFIKPKNNNADKVDWQISEQVREIVKNYTVYCEYRECEVVDMFSKAKNFLNGLMAYVTIKQ